MNLYQKNFKKHAKFYEFLTSLQMQKYYKFAKFFNLMGNLLGPQFPGGPSKTPAIL